LKDNEMIANLLSDNEVIVRYCRNAISELSSEGNKDFGTADFFTSLMQAHEKSAWMLGALKD
jgi:starvation-inducible DNA-binding protein